MVANYSGEKRRFDCYPTEAEARDAAQRLVRQLSERQVVAASMTNEQAAEYAAAPRVSSIIYLMRYISPKNRPKSHDPVRPENPHNPA